MAPSVQLSTMSNYAALAGIKAGHVDQWAFRMGFIQESQAVEWVFFQNRLRIG